MAKALIIVHAPPEAADCRALFYELLDVGLDVRVCGNTMKKLDWDQTYALPGITRGSMNALSALMSAADEIITL